MASVELKNVVKIYDGAVRAVDNATFTAKDKELVIIVGPSGCGKTTTLRLIAGLEELTEGNILIDGKLVNNVSPKNRDIAMVFQNYALYPHMTVYENIAFGLRIRKYPKDKIQTLVTEAAQILDIEELLYRKPKALSGGQRQRVALGRAIVRKPKVFLFDEPLSNLDAKLRVQMRAEILNLHDRLGATMIYVTHDQVEAMTMADRIVVMRSGIVQQIGPPMELYNHPANLFVAGFIGSPPMNFIRVHIEEDRGKIFAHEGAIVTEITGKNAERVRRYIGKEAILGIRPEDIACREMATGAKSIRARVAAVEVLGSELHVSAEIGKHTIVARVPPQDDLRIGDTVYIENAVEKAIFFDIESENAAIHTDGS